MEDGLTPAQQDAQAEPTNAEATIGADALEEVAKVADRSSSQRSPRRARENESPPHKMLYIGNLYYEVTAEQLKTVFSRFGEVASVKIVYDNRGLSRG
jgi:nucleolin